MRSRRWEGLRWEGLLERAAAIPLQSAVSAVGLLRGCGRAVHVVDHMAFSRSAKVGAADVTGTLWRAGCCIRVPHHYAVIKVFVVSLLPHDVVVGVADHGGCAAAFC